MFRPLDPLLTGLLAVVLIVPVAAAGPILIEAQIRGEVQPRLVSQGPSGILRGDGSAVMPGDLEPPVGAFSGVGDLLLFNPGQSAAAKCSGSRIGPRQVLTAAHCVTDSTGQIDFTQAQVDFERPDGSIERHTVTAITQADVHPDYNGNVIYGNDVAVLDLAATPSSDIEIYDIFRGSNEFGQAFEVVGYGRTGTGDQGSGGATGTKRAGFNRFSEHVFDFGVGDPDTVLWFDFDKGNSANDAFGQVDAALAELGVGPYEVNTAPGDSGGPSFIGDKIAAVTSFGTTSYNITVNGQPITSDIDTITNSTFGEFSGSARVSSVQSFIDAQVMEALPVPQTAILLLVGMGILAGAPQVKCRPN